MSEKAGYACLNGVTHPRAEWCRTHLTTEETAALSAILIRLGSCHIPHSEAWCSGGECPACSIADFIGLEDPDGTCPADWIMNKSDLDALRTALKKTDLRV